MMRARWIAAIASLALSFASPARAACTQNADCKGDRICTAGKCVAPPVEAPNTNTQTPTQNRAAGADGVPSDSKASKVHFTGMPGVVRVDDDSQCHLPCNLVIDAGLHDVVLNEQSFRLKVPLNGKAMTARFRFVTDTTDIIGGSIVTGIGFSVLLGAILAGTITITDEYGTTGTALNGGGVAVLGVPAAIVTIVGAVWLVLGITHSGLRLDAKSSTRHTEAHVDGRGVVISF